LYAPVTPPDDYIQNLTEVAEQLGLELSVGSVVVDKKTTPSDPSVEIEALDAFLSWCAEENRYFHPNVVSRMVLLPCFDDCTNASCQCKGLSVAMNNFLSPPAYWSKTGK